MSRALRLWLHELLEWARRYDVPAERVADLIIEAFTRGGDATTTPPDAGT